MMLLWQKIHGHVALLAIALAFHPVFALRRARRPSRWTRLAGYLATGTLLASTVLGWFIYPAYRQQIRRALYLENVRWGLMFEIKEHLAWYALALAIAGAALMWASARVPGSSGDLHRDLRRGVRWTYGLAGLLAAVSAGLGVALATIKAFPTVMGG